MEKLAFKLTDEQIGPFPVSVESLWCEREGNSYRIKNIPFFIDGLSFDDLILISNVSDGLVEVAAIVQKSGNSTVWVLINDEVTGKSLLDELNEIGCGVEGGALSAYYAVNVPSTVDFGRVQTLLEQGEQAGWIDCDFPSIRHESDEKE